MNMHIGLHNLKIYGNGNFALFSQALELSKNVDMQWNLYQGFFAIYFFITGVKNLH